MTDKSNKNIQVGDISNATGIAIGHGAKATVSQRSSSEPDAIIRVFSQLYQVLEQKPDIPEKAIATQAMKGLEEEAKKGEKANQDNVNKWFNFLITTLPDVGEVAINTFINPISGLSTVFQKVAKKVKETSTTS